MPSMMFREKRLCRNKVGVLAPGAWLPTTCVALDKSPNFLDIHNSLNRQLCGLDKMICKPLDLALHELMVETYFFQCMAIMGRYLHSYFIRKYLQLVGNEIELKQLAYP